MVFLQPIGDKVIANVIFRTLQQINITKDTGGAEFILIFQIAAVAPFEHEYCKDVFAFTNAVGHIEFAR